MRHKVKTSLGEKFWDGVKTRHGYAEVYQNPTARELGQLATFNVGIIVTQKAAFFWDRELALHAMVISELDLRGGLTLLANFDKDWDSYDATVSDTTKGTEFDHAPDLADFLAEHPYMQYFELGVLSYWDEAEVGRWEDMQDDEDDDEWGLGDYEEPEGAASARDYLGAF